MARMKSDNDADDQNRKMKLPGMKGKMNGQTKQFAGGSPKGLAKKASKKGGKR